MSPRTSGAKNNERRISPFPQPSAARRSLKLISNPTAQSALRYPQLRLSPRHLPPRARARKNAAARREPGACGRDWARVFSAGKTRAAATFCLPNRRSTWQAAPTLAQNTQRIAATDILDVRTAVCTITAHSKNVQKTYGIARRRATSNTFANGVPALIDSARTVKPSDSSSHTHSVVRR